MGGGSISCTSSIFLLDIRQGSHSASWCEPTLGTYPGAIIVEEDWDRRKGDTEEAENRCRPCNAQRLIHIVGKQRLHEALACGSDAEERTHEGCTCNAANEGVDRNGRIAVKAVAVDHVIHTLPKGNHAPTTQQG